MSQHNLEQTGVNTFCFHSIIQQIITSKLGGINPAPCLKVVKGFLVGHRGVFYLLVFSLFHYWYVPVWHDVRADSLVEKARLRRSAQSAPSLRAGGGWRLYNTSRPSPHALYVFLYVCVLAEQQYGPCTTFVFLD